MDEVVSLSLVLEGLTTEPRHFLSGTGGDVKHGSFWCYVWPPDASLLILRNGNGPKSRISIFINHYAAFSSFWLTCSCIFFGIMDSQPVTAPIFRPGIFSSSQENAGDLALAAILAGPPAVPVLLAALERLEKVNATGMVALQLLRFERLADLPLSTLRKLQELVEAFVSEKNPMTPGISVQLE